MAKNQSVLKQIRQNKVKKIRNKYVYKSTRTEIKKIKLESNNENIISRISRIVSMIDKLKKKNIIHKNKAARLKSQLAKQFNMAHSSIG